MPPRRFRHAYYQGDPPRPSLPQERRLAALTEETVAAAREVLALHDPSHQACDCHLCDNIRGFLFGLEICGELYRSNLPAPGRARKGRPAVRMAQA